MAVFALDTNVAIAIMRGDLRVRAKLKETESRDNTVVLPSVALFELEYGAGKGDRPKESAANLKLFLDLPIEVLPFSDSDAAAAGHLRATLGRAGASIGAYDVLIAGQALNRRMTLVTHNVREFWRVAGLQIEDWQSDSGS